VKETKRSKMKCLSALLQHTKATVASSIKNLIVSLYQSIVTFEDDVLPLKRSKSFDVTY